MIIVIHAPMGTPEKVVSFSSDYKALAYIKQHAAEVLSESPSSLRQLSRCASIDDVIALFDEEHLFELQVLKVDEIDPTVTIPIITPDVIVSEDEIYINERTGDAKIPVEVLNVDENSLNQYIKVAILGEKELRIYQIIDFDDEFVKLQYVAD